MLELNPGTVRNRTPINSIGGVCSTTELPGWIVFNVIVIDNSKS